MHPSHRIAWTDTRCHGSQTQIILDEHVRRIAMGTGDERFLAVQWLVERDVERADVRMANVRIEFNSTKVAESNFI
jgi:hypothetical protein